MHIYPKDWKYGITNSSDLSNIDFTQVYPTDQSGLRYSVDASQFVIKWEPDHEPSFITDGTVTPSSILSHSDCLVLMSTPEWSGPIE